MNDSQKSHILDELGDKVLEALAETILDAKNDFMAYQAQFPLHVADMTRRGFTNWVHDRIVARAYEHLEGVDRVTFADDGVTREVYVGTNLRLRFKAHAEPVGAVRNYPTPTALAFWEQDLASMLPGLGEIRLAVGYWSDPATFAVGDPVLSLRDSQENVLWTVDLLPYSATGTASATPITPTAGGPSLPAIEVEGSSGASEAGDVG